MASLKQELTTRDLMRMFNVSRQSIFNWRKTGLPYYKLGGNGLSDPTRYSLTAVVEFASKSSKVIVNEIHGSYVETIKEVTSCD